MISSPIRGSYLSHTTWMLGQLVHKAGFKCRFCLITSERYKEKKFRITVYKLKLLQSPT